MMLGDHPKARENCHVWAPFWNSSLEWTKTHKSPRWCCKRTFLYAFTEEIRKLNGPGRNSETSDYLEVQGQLK